MTSKVWIVAAVWCCSTVQGKILRKSETDIVRGHGFAAPPPGHHHLTLANQDAHTPTHQHTQLKLRKPKKPIKIISQFDKPGSFQPMTSKYSKTQFEPTTEKSFVSGPPLGDDFFDRYQEMIKRSQQQKQHLSFEGLLPQDIVERKKRKHRDPSPPGLHLIKPPVSLDRPSTLSQNFDFNPNGKWFGDKATGLLQPQLHNIKNRQVTLDFVSPSSGLFSPNSDWFGEKGSGFFEYPNHLIPKRETVHVTHPSRTESKENFSPSGWHVYRNNVIETGTRSSLYSSVEDEPAVITLDNVAEYLKTHHNSIRDNPDVFDVNVQAVIKTRDAPNASKQFYLQ